MNSNLTSESENNIGDVPFQQPYLIVSRTWLISIAEHIRKANSNYPFSAELQTADSELKKCLKGTLPREMGFGTPDSAPLSEI